jgi:very-short-patch-repair endonuclease
MRNAQTQRWATALRHRLTDSEPHLWQRIRRRQIRGLRFRRQAAVGPYIADFACLEIALIIEVDGGQHIDSAHDWSRDEYLHAQGYRVLRFWSSDVLARTDAVLDSIYQATDAPTLTLPRRPGEGKLLDTACRRVSQSDALCIAD